MSAKSEILDLPKKSTSLLAPLVELRFLWPLKFSKNFLTVSKQIYGLSV